MPETSRLAALIQHRIDEALLCHKTELSELGEDILPVLDEASAYLQGGKRMRAQFALLGYRSVQPLDLFADPAHDLAAVIDAACALEFFHAAALIHDDVIDRSDTRRGRLAAHRHFEALHQTKNWRGSAERFGIATAILLGDLLQSWADELMQSACNSTAPQAAASARAQFHRMRSEVAFGQYLDVVEEQQTAFFPERVQLERSTRVLVYKSAKYSVEAPLLIGAALAGVNPEQEQALTEFGLPVGVAFQLRDDLLGVFGDEQHTGKPAGDDLREGKRTVLVTLAREQLPATQQRLFDEMLGDESLDREQVKMLQQTIRDSGAVERVEHMIAQNITLAEAALDFAPLSQEAREQLIALAHKAGHRIS